MNKQIIFVVPMKPITANLLWRKMKGKVIRSPAYERWVIQFLYFVPNTKPIEGDVKLSMRFNLKGRKRFDLDNMFKGVIDACTAAGLWKDDSQVCEIRGVKILGSEEDSITIAVRWEDEHETSK